MCCQTIEKMHKNMSGESREAGSKIIHFFSTSSFNCVQGTMVTCEFLNSYFSVCFKNTYANIIMEKQDRWSLCKLGTHVGGVFDLLCIKMNFGCTWVGKWGWGNVKYVCI